MITPGADAEGDSVEQFASDLRAELEQRGVSGRVAAKRAGWTKSTVSAALQGRTLPNVDLVADTLQALGADDARVEAWRQRHRRLKLAAATRTPSSMAREPDPGPLPATRSEPGPVLMAPPEPAALSLGLAPDPLGQVAAPGSAESHRGRRRRVFLGAVTVTVLAVTAVGWWAARPADTPSRTIVVQNKVAVGPSDLVEDDTPSFLAARPIAYCADEPGCVLEGTELFSGDTVTAVCQLQGALLTNANVRSPGIRDNPNVAGSALWYGITWSDGRRGYLSEIYVAPMYRGGLQLPPC